MDPGLPVTAMFDSEVNIGGDVQMFPNLNVLGQHLQRVKMVYASFEDKNQLVAPDVYRPLHTEFMPALRSLTLQVEAKHGQWTREAPPRGVPIVDLPEEHFPNLQTLHLDGVVMPWDNPIASRLTRLELRNYPSRHPVSPPVDFIQALPHWTCLNRLVIHDYLSAFALDHMPLTKYAVASTSLTELVIHDTSGHFLLLANHVFFPACTSLKISGNLGPLEDPNVEMAVASPYPRDPRAYANNTESLAALVHPAQLQPEPLDKPKGRSILADYSNWETFLVSFPQLRTLKVVPAGESSLPATLAQAFTGAGTGKLVTPDLQSIELCGRWDSDEAYVFMKDLVWSLQVRDELGVSLPKLSLVFVDVNAIGKDLLEKQTIDLIITLKEMIADVKVGFISVLEWLRQW